MKLYIINKWNELYENNRSRSVSDLTWVPISNRHDGEHYTAIVSHEHGSKIFAAFILMVEVASRCQPRGMLIRDNRTPHTAQTLSTKTRAPIEWFELAIKYLEKETDWLLVQDFQQRTLLADSQLSDDCQADDTEGKGREGKGIEWKEVLCELPAEADYWNRYSGSLPKVLAWTPSRNKHLVVRRKDPFWVQNLEKAINKVAVTPFCIGDNKTGWRASFDWLLQSDVVAKIMEGKYDGSKTRVGNSASNPRNEGVARSSTNYGDAAKRKAQRPGA